MNLIDKFHVYEDGKIITLQDYLFTCRMDPKLIGLEKLDHFQDCYAMYYDFSARNHLHSIKKYNGLCLYENGKVKTSTIPKGQIAIAIIHHKIK